jgi:hypothetical protein
MPVFAGTTSSAPAAPATAPQDAAAPRVGLGQAAANEPAQLGKLRLTDPLVQQKYLNEPDMLRFLRGTYSEACARGMVDQASKQISVDIKREYTEDQRKTATRLQESRRVWKMTSFEMETLYGAGYLTAANYCDCLMREVSDADLVNPRKGLEVIEKLPQSTQRACESNAKDQTVRQLRAREKANK